MRLQSGFTATRHAQHGFGSDERNIKYPAAGLWPCRLGDERDPGRICRDARFLE